MHTVRRIVEAGRDAHLCAGICKVRRIWSSLSLLIFCFAACAALTSTPDDRPRYWAAEHYPDAFTDITIGGTGFDSEGTPCSTSYKATKGWDAATGLGVPNTKVLMQAAVKYVSLQHEQRHKHKPTDHSYSKRGDRQHHHKHHHHKHQQHKHKYTGKAY